MGLVYKAKCHLLNRYVAVKILKPELTEDEEFINKFRKESLSSASLSHPNIVSIYDVGAQDGIYYIVMEYVNGKTLKELIKEKAPMAAYDVINIARQICIALEHAHSNNIIHRDIKPQNILVTHDGIVKVADFGIARVSNSSTLTNTGSVLGTAYYISPEQARGGYVDEKTDIYSLGIVMYEMATGKVPFDGESPVTVALKHLQEEPMKPSELNENIPPALEGIILKCLAKNPASRYESATELIKDLDRASQNPNSTVKMEWEDPNNMTKVMPIINNEGINNNDYDDDDGDEDIPIDKKKKKKVNKGLIAAFVIIFAAVAVGAIFAYLKGMEANKPIPIPNIEGQQEEVAKKMLEDVGLYMEVKETVNDDEIAKGIVMKSYPDVGFPVKKGFTVKVKVSAGPKMVTIPNIINSTVDEAELTLNSSGLSIGERYEMNNDKIEKGKIFKQEPNAEGQLIAGGKVDIYISKGPEIKVVPVPNLLGDDIEKVKKKLEKAGLELGEVLTDTDLNQKDNVVIKQSPKEDMEVREGSPITVWINKLPEVTPTPTPTPTEPPDKKEGEQQ
jgi:serine/threonine-protein kinase